MTKNPSLSDENKTKKRAKLSLKEKLDNAPAIEFVPNEVVLATIPGYCPWPARIFSITNNKIFVEFFGTGQM